MTEDLLRVERQIAAPPADVFRYLTDSVAWARWQGASAEIDPVAGGRFRMVMAQGPIAEGRLVEVVPNVRIVFTWGWVGSETLPPGSSTVEIDLSAVDGGTLLRLTHRGLPLAEQQFHRGGWDHYLRRLAIVASGGDAGPDPGPG